MDKAIFVGLIDNPPNGIEVEIDANLYRACAKDLIEALTTLGPKELSEAKLFKTNAVLELAESLALGLQIAQQREHLFPELDGLLKRVSEKQI